MKKLSVLFLLFSILFSSYFHAQNNEVNEKILVEKDPAKLRFGLMGFSSVGWLAPENDIIIKRANPGIGFGWGLNTEIFINKTTSFRTGISLSTFKASLYYNDNELTSNSDFDKTYYVVNKREFQQWPDDNTNLPDGEIRQLTTRKYKLSYVNIPLMLKLKTKEIGYLTYFGEFGGIVGFKTKAKVEDKYLEVDTLTYEPLSDSEEKNTTSDYDLQNGTQLIRAGLCVGAGVEYNFSGSTSLFFQVNWNYFMTNMMRKKEKDDYLRSFDSDLKKFEKVNSKSIPGSIIITVGILF